MAMLMGTPVTPSQQQLLIIIIQITTDNNRRLSAHTARLSLLLLP